MTLRPDRRLRMALALGLGGALSGALAAQGTVRGLVRDKDFEAPLPGARVTVLEINQQAVTNDQGNFSITGVPAGTYTLTIAKEGYVRQVRPDVLVQSGQLTDITVDLAGDFQELEPFEVRGVLQLGGDSEAALLNLRFESPSLLDSISSEFLSQASASDAAEALRLVAGATVKDGRSAVIRGLPDRYVSSQLNGVRLPSSDNDVRAVDLDLFPSQVIESVQVAKTFTPDQQADASGGAVNVLLRGVPAEEFYATWSFQGGMNSQVTGRGRFLTYEGGGLDYFGDDDSRQVQIDNIGEPWDGAAGVSRGEAPFDYKYNAGLGGSYEFDSGARIGGFANFTYERDSLYYDNGVDDQLVQLNPGEELVPLRLQNDGGDEDFLTSLYDEERGRQELQWTGLMGAGVEFENHSISTTWLYSRSASDTAIFREDTRGKLSQFPGYDPDDRTTPGHDLINTAPFQRQQTLLYRERVTTSLQVRGRHVFPFLEAGPFLAPELDWTIARSNADSNQPDRRQFGGIWTPFAVRGFPPFTFDRPAQWNEQLPAANVNLGNFNRIFERVEEESSQWFANLKLPFEQWDGREGYLKTGYFIDEVERSFDQETFGNFLSARNYEAGFEELWTDFWQFQDVPIDPNLTDADYDGRQEVSGYYVMLDLPLNDWATLITGVRFENTQISTRPTGEEFTLFFDAQSGVIDRLEGNEDRGTADFEQDDVLPAVALVMDPLPGLTIRMSYAETIARQNFKEITPIIQQEFLGGPIFVGNPNLRAASIKNYDFRVDYRPYDGGLLSASYFYKDLKDPIELVQSVDPNFAFTFAENYPEGFLEGVELEIRQDVGLLLDQFGVVADDLKGLQIGGNATFIDSEVSFRPEEIQVFQSPAIQAPLTTRNATNAPEYLYNLYFTYEVPVVGTRLAVFYTVTGDTLIAGAGLDDQDFVPSLFQKPVENLNATISHDFNGYLNIRLSAKNLLNPEIDTVYREDFLPGGDRLARSFTRGVDYSLRIGGNYRF